MIAKGITVVIPIGSTDLTLQLVNCIRSIERQRDLIPFPIYYTVAYLYPFDTCQDRYSLVRALTPYGATIATRPGNHLGGFETPRARNLGAACSPTEWLLFADSDLLFPPGVLRVVGDMLSNDNVCVVVDVDDVQYDRMAPACFELNWAKLAVGATPRNGAHGCLAVPREAWARVRGYDEAYRGWGADDQDFRERVERAGWQWWGTRTENSVVYHQKHERTPANMVHCDRNRARFFAGRDENRTDEVNADSIGGYEWCEKQR